MTSIRFKAGLRRAKPEPPKPPTRLARMIALAHLVDRWMECGVVRNYSEAAERLGITRARMSQLMNVLLLTPPEMERVLLGDDGRTERAMRGR